MPRSKRRRLAAHSEDFALLQCPFPVHLLNETARNQRKPPAYLLSSGHKNLPGTSDTVSADNKYSAFISYSHKDEKWASWLHKALETFKVPKYLVGETTAMGTVPERMAKVFRDRGACR